MQKIKTSPLLKIFILCLLLNTNLSANQKTQEAFKILSDILQFLPVAAASYSLAIKDYEGLKDLAIGYSVVLGSTFVSKISFDAIGKKYPNAVRFAQRPNYGNFQGFPSGHTSSAFSAAGFMQRRYGWKFGLPTFLLASLTGVSRIIAQKHTIFQVSAGAMLGFGVTYALTSQLPASKGRVTFDIQSDKRGRETYSLSYFKRF